MLPLIRLAFAASLAVSPLAQDDGMGWTGVLDEEAFAALHDLNESDAPEPRGEEIELGEARAYLSLPPVGDPVGGVVVIHEWWGLNGHIQHWTDRLAADGYAALAVDLYGGTVATTRDEAMAAMRGVDGEAATATLRAAVEYLRDGEEGLGLDRIGSIGWCFGGGWSLKLAIADADLDAAVVYYGRLVSDVEQLSEIGAPVLGIFGTQDSGIPPEAVEKFAEAMDEAGGDLTLHSYDAPHAFANPSSARYVPDAAAEAWRETRSFLCEHLHHDAPRSSRSMEYDAPNGWSQGEEHAMRIATFHLEDGALLTLSSLRGGGGGVLPNVNRWRAQLGADPLDEDELEELPHVPIFGALAPLVVVEGRFQGMGHDLIEDAALLATLAPIGDEMVFVKLVGPRDAVEEAGEAFAAFCRSLR